MMADFICKHRLISVGDPEYEWCRQCGILIYRYEEFMQIPSCDIKMIDGCIIYNKSKNRIIKSRIIEPSNIRDLQHNHDFFVLSANDAWCKTCGILRIKRTIFLNDGLNIQAKEGLLIHQRRLSYCTIVKETETTR